MHEGVDGDVLGDVVDPREVCSLDGVEVSGETSRGDKLLTSLVELIPMSEAPIVSEACNADGLIKVHKSRLVRVDANFMAYVVNQRGLAQNVGERLAFGTDAVNRKVCERLRMPTPPQASPVPAMWQLVQAWPSIS